MSAAARAESAVPEGFSVQAEDVGDAVVLSVIGEVDMGTAPVLEESIKEALKRDPGVLVVDLSRVDFLASAGMSVLIGGNQQAGEATSFRLVAAGSATLRPMELTGIASEFAIHPTRDQALAGG
ncbi:MAG TPA: STAS domain-containing protein [Actinophytocola sp.]|uniref:STAS domain-containing protein n=1 Tax=Actinophytocola sp. TaxID=1872138 RepID=UPI002F957FAC